MLNSEGHRNLDWLALPCCPIPSWVIMLLAIAALLALPIPAALAAGCTAFEVRFGKPDENGISKEIGSYYVMVPDSNFLTGVHKIYIDEKCDAPPEESDPDYGDDELFSPGSAFAKNGRKAMEICERNMDQTVAEVMRVLGSDFRYTYFYCEVGERKGPERQRREHLFTTNYNGEDAKGALAKCRANTRGYPKHARPNHAEPAYDKHWSCYRTWRVNNRYLRRVGA